jgi:hypothetical protein
MAIDVLPDDVLLEIFDFCVGQDMFEGLIPEVRHPQLLKYAMEVWRPLVHVCRRWRSLVFGSPHRLHLRLCCTTATPARDTLDVWPALPLLVWEDDYGPKRLDNFIPVLERADRVCLIHLSIRASDWEKFFSAAMQVPFPELTFLRLILYDTVIVLPDPFLGGSAPRLDTLWLRGVSFPGLPKLLLSATHLTNLLLLNIPYSGYISPEDMVTALSTLTSLDHLRLEFASPRSCPDPESRRPPPLRRSVLPALTSLKFKGVSEYLEDLVACIDAPRLSQLDIAFFNDLEFDTPQFIRFICRTLLLEKLKKAHIFFKFSAARVILTSQTSVYGRLKVGIICRESDWQVSSLEQVCTSCLPPLSTLEELYIHENPHSRPHRQDKVENMQWLELLQPFTAVKSIYLSKEFSPRILPALQELVGRRTRGVLPILQNIFLEELEPSGPVQEAIAQFVAARQVTNHPIAVSRWDNSEEDKIWR